MSRPRVSDSLLRSYEPEECGKDGYPPEWHEHIKYRVRAIAGQRCIRCHHPYKSGEYFRGEWTRCDEKCAHGMPARCEAHPFESLGARTTTGKLIAEAKAQGVDRVIEAQWRILTVHHLDRNKANCRWWNLVALCQRCHLQIQGKVRMERVWPWEHSEWFQPYVAGYYAHVYLAEDLDRATTLARLDELLLLEREVGVRVSCGSGETP